jgi:membrane protein YqaA with SNARE-associated domain
VIEGLKQYKQRLYKVARDAAKSKYADVWLMLTAFSEASFFLLPPDVLLVGILFSSAQRIRWKYWAAVTTLSSVIGGLFGYLIGVGLFDVLGRPIIEFYNLQAEVTQVGAWFNQYAFWTVFVSAFTPIPYKVFTISAGLFRIPVMIFVVASLLGRGIRFFVIAYIMRRYGKRVLRMTLRYFNIISIILILGVVLLIFL